MAPHSSTLAWKIPWMEEPGRLQSMGSQGVGHNWATSLSLFTFMRWRRKWQPTPVLLPGESQGRGVWWAAVSGITQSQTWLKWLSSSSSSRHDSDSSFLWASSAVRPFSHLQASVWPSFHAVLWGKMKGWWANISLFFLLFLDCIITVSE